MPRDDLSIDFVNAFKSQSAPRMPQVEHQDCAAVLDEWANRVANLPAEIAFMQEEIEEKDRQLSDCLTVIARNDAAIQKWIKMNSSHTPNPKDGQLSQTIMANYQKAKLLQQEKIALAQKTQLFIDKHTRYLDGQIKTLQDRGEFPNDPDIPSLLRPQPQPDRALQHSVAAMPLGQISHAGNIPHPQHAVQQPRVPPTQAQMQHMVNGSAIPTPPTASLLLNRNARESSLPAAKRSRISHGLGHLPPSGLARHSSLTPGTPRSGTPSSTVRAGSAGPRNTKGIITKRLGPQSSSRPSGVGRKRPGKSSLNRLKRPGKGSPTSTADSELSDAETGSVDEDDENGSPPLGRKDADGDMEMIEGEEDDEAGDEKKYCMCQSVSYGSMVACDNEQCPYEWFHWTCVGLKSEPVGTWICPICSPKINGAANG